MYTDRINPSSIFKSIRKIREEIKFVSRMTKEGRITRKEGRKRQSELRAKLSGARASVGLYVN